MTILLISIIIISYGIIHFLEFSSFLSRISGILVNSKVTGYTVQQANFVMTRFFFVAMMPLIGLVVDLKIEKKDYLLMVISSLFSATLAYLFVFLFYKKIIFYFCKVIDKYKITGNLIFSFFPKEKKITAPTLPSLKNAIFFIFRNREGKKLFFASSIVFCCYSIGVFISFFVALNFYEYRSAIGQLSGLINALATVLLTFYIEPKISISIDRNEANSQEKILVMLLGRFIGVSIYSQIILFFILILNSSFI